MDEYSLIRSCYKEEYKRSIMRKLLNAGIIKRDLSFPVYFQGYPIPANPGDTLASAILANSREQIMTSYPFSHKDYLTSMWGNPGHFFHVKGKVFF